MPAPQPAAAAGPIAGAQFAGFGTTIGVWVTKPEVLPTAERVLRSWVERVDATCSRFRADSDLERVNRHAGTAGVVAVELLDAVAAALDMAEASQGWYDPTAGAAVVAAGYDRPFQALRLAGPGKLAPPAPAGRWQDVRVDRAASTLTVPEGTLLDLGGSAKGWAADRALQLIEAAVGGGAAEVGVCINAGGDLAVSGPAPAGGWPVRVSHTLDGPAAAADTELHLFAGALATSGAVTRRWRIDGHEFHHLVDPRTGRPGEEHWRLVTVHATRCAVADPAATVAWLLGPAAPEWLGSLGLTARLVHRDGDVRWVGRPAATLSAG